MENRYTKLYQKERELLRKTNSVNCYEVYMHLKDKYSYFKEDCYDLMKCISEYLDIPQRSVKDAIKRLKEVGLIDTVKRGKVNVYSFPMLEENINNNNKPEPMCEETKPTPIYAEEFNDNDFRFGEIDTTDPMLSFLIEDEETFDDKIKRYIPYLKEVEYGSNEFYNRMKKVIADFPMGEKKYADQEIKRILAA